MKIRFLSALCIAIIVTWVLLFIPHSVVSLLYVVICGFSICEITYASIYSSAFSTKEFCRIEYIMIAFSAFAVTIFDNLLAGYLLVLCTLSDAGGYLAGKLLGKKAHRVGLLRNISPNKTWEGYLAGMLCSIVLGLLCYWILRNYLPTNGFWFAFFAWIPAIFGDLFESFLKRKLSIKDSSDGVMSSRCRLLRFVEKPMLSQGGYLDRMDSFVFTSIAYLIFNSFWQ